MNVVIILMERATEFIDRLREDRLDMPFAE
jgi:hypothetical protein